MSGGNEEEAFDKSQKSVQRIFPAVFSMDRDALREVSQDERCTIRALA